jgi:hypothetical protein
MGNAAMRLILILFAMLAAIFVAYPNAAMAAGDASVRAKCEQKYPGTGTTLERRRNGAMRKQCIASGGKD